MKCTTYYQLFEYLVRLLKDVTGNFVFINKLFTAEIHSFLEWAPVFKFTFE